MEIVVVREHGFVNVRFPLRAKEAIPAKDGSVVFAFHFGGMYEGKMFRGSVALSSEWDERRDGLPVPTYWSDIGVYVTDSEERGFVPLLVSQYGLNVLDVPKQKEAVNARVVSIGEKPVDVLNKATRLKVFFGPPLHPEYAEFYLNIDSELGIVEINEKDPEYRAALVRALTE